MPHTVPVLLALLGLPAAAAPPPDWSAAATDPGVSFGAAVATGGDVDGDGFEDVVVGAPYWNDRADRQVSVGALFLYRGSPAGASVSPDWSVETEVDESYLGDDVAIAGDVDGDGFDDVLAGTHYWTLPAAAPQAFLYRGGPSGPSATPDWSTWIPEVPNKVHVAHAGDVDGDGFDDVLVGWPFRGVAAGGAVALHLGSPAGPSAAEDWLAQETQGGAWLGTDLAGGDVNGDGYADLLATASSWDGGEADEGAAFLYLGAASGPSAAPAWTGEGDEARANLGAVAAGDVDRDGFSDVIVGVPLSGTSDGGAVRVYLGSPTGPSAAPLWESESGQAQAALGGAVASGDVNGDGFADVLASAASWDGPEVDEGAAFVFLGSPTGPSAAPDWTAESDLAWGALGSAVGLGDTDGDGLDDVLVGMESQDAAMVWRGWTTDSDADGVDSASDCDDFDATVGALVWYADADADGFGDPGAAVTACTPSDGLVADGTDCDDGSDAVRPDAEEACNGIDDDCDGGIDGPGAVDAPTWYADVDADGFGDPTRPIDGCEPPDGAVDDATDCDDGASEVNPGAPETCDGADDDCDGAVDEGCEAGTRGQEPAGECGCATGAPALGGLAGLLAVAGIRRRR